MPIHRRLQARTSIRGYTLAELMIVVAMIGVMAALAIAGYKKYVNAAQSSEAKAMIQGIRAGEESYKSDMLVYLGCSTSLVDYYPSDPTANQNDKKWAWVRPNDVKYNNTTNGWQLLNVQADAPVRFGYAVVAGVGATAPPALDFVKPPTGWPPAVNAGIPWYTVQAVNKRSTASPKVLFMSWSGSGEIYSENEGE
jgi:type IV pilus assembly protein PilA